MAKLYLKFEQAVLKEFPLTGGVVTVGRLPDNNIQVDNLAVSGHHAKIYWEGESWVVEDNNSLNGTFINNRKISKSPLKTGDEVLIGKHTLLFKEDRPGERPATTGQEKTQPVVPRLEATMVLDTRKAQEMLSRTQPPKAPAPAGGGAGAAPAPSGTTAPMQAPSPAKERIGTLTVVDGKTDHANYVLTGKLSVIGKSDMASIKLKGWFAPKVAAVINRRDNHYFIAASEKDTKVKVNNALIAGQHELDEGDVIEVAGVKMTFSFE